MDDDNLIGLLPAPYAVAVRLRRAGAPDATIAVAAAVDEAAVAPLVALAEAKLRTLARATPRQPSRADESHARDQFPEPAPNAVEAHP
jgi:hypothetical protein